MTDRTSDVENPDELHAFVNTMRLHKWMILMITAAVLGVAMVRSYLETPAYQSQARIVVRQSLLPGQLFNMQTESQLLTSEPIAEEAAEILQYEGDPNQLLSGLGVVVSTQTEILLVNYVSVDPAEAQARAQAFADAYLNFRKEQVDQSVGRSQQRLLTQISTLNERITVLTREVTRADNYREESQLQVQLNGLISQLAALEQQRTELLLPEEVDVGSVIQPATLPSTPFTPRYSQNAVLGIFLGLVLGVLAAFIRERLDDRLRGRHDFERRLGHSVLAVIPRVAGWRRPQETNLVTVKEPHSVTSEAYKTLRTSTLFVASSSGARLLMIAGPLQGEGKTTTLANLGVALAHSDRRVIIVSGDLRRPRLHSFFGLDSQPGLTTVLSGEVELKDALNRVGVDKLRVLTSGPTPMNPAEVLGSEAMGALLEGLRGLADIVLLDSPPILAVADALVLAPLTDGVIFVSDPKRSTRRSVTTAARQLEQVNANVLGGVLNNFDLSGATPYGYGSTGTIYGSQESTVRSQERTSRLSLRRQARS